MIRIALIQTNSQNDMVNNLAQLNDWVLEAAKAGAKMVFTPENTLFMAASSKELHAHAHQSGAAVTQLELLAKECGVWLLIGSLATPDAKHKNKLHNRSLLIDPSGKIVTHYDKIHLYQASVDGGESHDETRNYSPGDQAVLARTPIGPLGLTICYDLRFAALFRHLAQAGATAITVPSAFTHATGGPHWLALLRARAIENGCYIIAPAQVGDHPAQRKTYGHSVVIDPWGEIVAQRTTEPGLLLADIDSSRVAEIRTQLPSLQHDRAFS